MKWWISIGALLTLAMVVAVAAAGLPTKVHYVSSAKVAEVMAKGGQIIGDEGFVVLANRRGAADAELHDATNHVFIIVEGEATFVTGGTLIEFASRVTTTGGDVKLDGDPQHSGFHFRATNEVADKTKGETYYLRPDGRDKPGGRRGKDVPVEVIGVNDLDAPPPDVLRQARLLADRRDAAEGRHGVLGQRNVARQQFVDESAPSPQARELDIESQTVEHPRERHELVFGAAAHQRGHHVENASSGHGCSRRRVRAISARYVFFSATAKPAMLKK